MKKILVLFVTLFFCQLALANSEDPRPNLCAGSFFSRMSPHCAQIALHLGVFTSSFGLAQQINIEDLVGDYFTVSGQNKYNVLVGAGYFLNAVQTDRLKIMAGLDAYYLGKITVHGEVIQENLFTNLSYQYGISNIPIYADAKASIPTCGFIKNLSLDVGIGPNVIRTHDFSEQPLDGGITIPDWIFSGDTHVAFSATAGIGIIFENVCGSLPLEIGYRFFYLGEGRLKNINSQVLNTLTTGNNYANAIVISTCI